MKRCVVMIAIVGLIFPLARGMAGDPSFYAKKHTWVETMFASRLGMRTEKMFFEERMGIRPDSWYVLGPFKSVPDSSFAHSFLPQNEVVLDKAYENGTLHWTRMSEWADGAIVPLPPVDYSATYIYRGIRATRDTSVSCYLGSDDGIQVWLNGTLIFSHDIYRGCRPNQDTASLTLRAGENSLLMKINNGQGAYAFYFSLRPVPPFELWSLLERDFPDVDSRSEMRREISDGIWEEFSDSAGIAGLAATYMKKTRYDTPGLRDMRMNAASAVTKWEDLHAIRREYHESIQKEYVVLTPKPSPAPKINGPVVFGVRPGAAFLYTIPATGARPMEFKAQGLPAGLSLDTKTGMISGSLDKMGAYRVTLLAKNSMGTSQRRFRIVVGNAIALTPPLGWNSWNCFAGVVDDRKVRSAADAMVQSGLVDHGWTYINIDDCWMVKPESQDPWLGGIARDSLGMINSNKKFPSMLSLSDYVHGKGLKLGIYSSPGPTTCAGFMASYGHEQQDANRFGEWGIDYLKYDWCSYGEKAKNNSLAEYRKPYAHMRAALDKVNRDIVYSLCQYGMGKVWEWGAEVGGNCWRTSGDITDTWKSMSDIGFSQNGHEKWAGPGHWNDPDMLVVGMVGWGEGLRQTGLSGNEQYMHMSLWALLAAPMLIGCDMTHLDEFTFGLLTNDEVLEVNQDPLGIQARRVSKSGDLEVWTKEMEDGSKAVGLFNRGEYAADISCEWQDLGITGKRQVRDLWRQRNFGLFEGNFVTRVPRHGVVLVRIF